MSAGDPTPSLFDRSGPDRSGSGAAPDSAPAPKSGARAASGSAASGAEPEAAAPKPAGAARRASPGRRKGSSGKASGLTPMMQQYYRAKKDAGDALLLFRMGDFYELFHDDAKVAARVLGITLTARSKGDDGVPMAGVPVKAYEGYVQTLIGKGYRVAICDQVEDPKTAKGIVDREVTRIVTAGTVWEDDLLRPGASNWLLAVWPPAGAGSGSTAKGEARAGLAWLDLSTGDFRVASVPAARLADEVSRLDPAEVLLPEALLEAGGDDVLAAALRRVTRAPLVAAPQWTFQPDNAHELLCEQFGVKSLAGFGLSDGAGYVSAAGAVLAYARDTQRGAAPAIAGVHLHDPGASAGLDRATRSCLEILATQREGRREGSLLSVVDATRTAMGARLLREWLVAPLVDPERIRRRQSAVAELVDRRPVADTLADALDDLPDLERIATRLLSGRASPRDLAALRAGLRAAPGLRAALEQCDSAPLADAGRRIEPQPELLDLLERGLADPPAPVLADGGVIADGFDARLDELRGFKRDGTAAIARFQAERYCFCWSERD